MPALLRKPLLVVVALLAALLLPGGWQQARADAPDPRILRPGIPGTPLAWGSNTYGQLGDGSTPVLTRTPGQLCGNPTCTAPLQNTLAVASGGGHSLALRSDGTVLAWGTNFSGELGNGTQNNSTTPVRVCAPGESAPCSTFLTDVVAVSAGAGFSMALRTNGTVVAWGHNGIGQLGNNTAGTTSSIPVAVCSNLGCPETLTNVVAISAGGNHGMALLSSGHVTAWGFNFNGQLGNDSTTSSPVPVYSFTSDIVGIAAGGGHSLAVRRDGTVHAWGHNYYGQLGVGDNDDRHTPTPVCAPSTCDTLLSGISAVSANALHSVALRSEGSVRTWGDNGSGQLGNGTTSPANRPVRVCAPGVPAPCGSYLSGATGVASGFLHTLARLSDTTVRSWGTNAFGQLGDGTQTDRSTPVTVCAPGNCGSPLTGVNSVAAGGNYSLTT